LLLLLFWLWYACRCDLADLLELLLQAAHCCLPCSDAANGALHQIEDVHGV
jgi:hypothetical protein